MIIAEPNSINKFNFPLSIITNSIFLPINKFNFFFLSIITNFHKNTNNQKKKVIHGKTLPEGCVCVCVRERERGRTDLRVRERGSRERGRAET